MDFSHLDVVYFFIKVIALYAFRQYGFKVDSDIAVVVQRMIDSDSAGVLFTCHPTTHDLSKMVITGNFGLGEVWLINFLYLVNSSMNTCF